MSQPAGIGPDGQPLNVEEPRAPEHTTASATTDRDKHQSRSSRPVHPQPTQSDLGDQVLSRYTLYETQTRFYITASSSSTHHRVLKIDRTTPNVLTITQDHAVYDTQQLHVLLRMVDDGNKSAGGLEKVLDFHGIIGFVRFTAGYYAILCTKRSVVSLIGGHYIFHCDETLMISVSNKNERSAEEARLLSTFQQVDLSKNFYFSYSYDLTNTLQTNLTRQTPYPVHNTHFMWNYSLVVEAFRIQQSLASEHETRRERDYAEGESRVESGEDTDDKDQATPSSSWLLPLVHGFVDQAKIPVLGRTIYATLIARRSRRHAGTRYLKRGVNELGHVANEVETEQIVSEPLVTSFTTNSTKARIGSNSNYTSFVQIRGSIPLHWTQDTTNMSPRPPIGIAVADPFFSAAALHFNNLLERYGAPIVIVNLIKGKEAVARESKLLAAYAECVAYLNQFLPPEEDKKLRYIAWDMAQATKSKSQDVIGILEDIAEESIQLTKFFHGGVSTTNDPEKDLDPTLAEIGAIQLQHGICRTNCIDCLDRTNAAQFSIGKKALGHQLHALGAVVSPDLGFDSDVIDMLIEMYHDHGDTLAWQYTGSALVNRMDTYRRTKTKVWSSHSRDLLENVKRYYTNSLLDADKQAAMDLFLGIDVKDRTRPPKRLDYQSWYDPETLERAQVPLKLEKFAPSYDIWVDYYKPHLLSQFQRLYTFTMNSTTKTAARSSSYTSPFDSRVSSKNRHLKKQQQQAKLASGPTSALKLASSRGLASASPAKGSVSSGSQGPPAASTTTSPRDPAALQMESLVNQLVSTSISATKKEEYEWYTHYQTNEAMSSESAEADDLELYVASINTSKGAGAMASSLCNATGLKGLGFGGNLAGDEGARKKSDDPAFAFYEKYLKDVPEVGGGGTDEGHDH